MNNKFLLKQSIKMAVVFIITTTVYAFFLKLGYEVIASHFALPELCCYRDYFFVCLGLKGVANMLKTIKR